MLRVNELCNIFYLLVEEMCMFQDPRITYLQKKGSSNYSSFPGSMIPEPYYLERTTISSLSFKCFTSAAGVCKLCKHLVVYY